MLIAFVFAALLPLQSPPSTTIAAPPRDVEGVEAEPDEPAPPPVEAVADPAAIDDDDDDAQLVSPPASPARRRAAAIARHDDAVRRAMIVGFSGLGGGLLLGAGLAFIALVGPKPLSLVAGFAAPVAIVAAPTTLLLFADDIDPMTPWFTAGGVFMGGLVGGIVGAAALIPLSTMLYGNPVESAVVLVPLGGMALGAAGGVVLATSGAGNHVDIE